MARTALEAAKLFVEFANETGSPYHTVTSCVKLLVTAGFTELREGQPWKLATGGKYYVTKGGADIMAFIVGGKFKGDSQDSGISMVGAHTDSPCLRLRPNSKMSSAGMLQVGVQTYGGGLWHTWFDRPLGFAGKAVVRDASGMLSERLVRVPDPVMLVPNLAIHLQTADERKAFNVNTESHLQPVLCSSLFEDEAFPVEKAAEKDSKAEAAKAKAVKMKVEVAKMEMEMAEMEAQMVEMAPMEMEVARVICSS